MLYMRIALFLSNKNNWKYIGYGLIVVIGILCVPFMLMFGVVPQAEKADAQKYADVGNELGLDWRQLIAFDMARYDNKIEGKDPTDAAYYFIYLQEQKLKENKICVETDENGDCKTYGVELVVSKTTIIKGKDSIISFLKKRNAKGSTIAQKVQSINTEKDRIIIFPYYIDDAMKNAKFTKEQKEHAKGILESGILDEMYPELASFSIVPGTCVGNVSPNGKAIVNKKVQGYDALIKKYANQFGIPQYAEIIKSMMMAETHGEGTDPMQASESAYGDLDKHCVGKKGAARVNCIQDPEISINAGVQNAKRVFQLANFDILVAIQTYNYGDYFATWIKSHGGHYTLELSQLYSNTVMKSAGQGLGTPNHALKVVQQFYSDPGCSTSINLSTAPGQQIFDVNQVLKVMLQYKGYPYHWGGASPSTSFDCSGLMQYAFKQVSINLPRTAREQYAFTARVSTPIPGDLIFWKTYDPNAASHVGIYVGKGADPSNPDNDFFESGGEEGKVGLRFNNSDKTYYKQRFLGYGRIIRR